MVEKFLIEICLNLNDGFSDKCEELKTSGLVVMDSFVIEEKEKEAFMTHNLPIILKGFLDDGKDLYKNIKSVEKITKKDFIVRIQPLIETRFIFI